MAVQGDNSSSTDEEIQESSEKHKRRRVQKFDLVDHEKQHS
jgi:hypothetical protein